MPTKWRKVNMNMWIPGCMWSFSAQHYLVLYRSLKLTAALANTREKYCKIHLCIFFTLFCHGKAKEKAKSSFISRKGCFCFPKEQCTMSEEKSMTYSYFLIWAHCVTGNGKDMTHLKSLRYKTLGDLGLTTAESTSLSFYQQSYYTRVD